MSAPLPEIARTVLHKLLDQHEQPDRKTVKRVRLTPADYPAYFAEQDAGPRQAANAALTELAERGWLELRWVKYEAGNWLQAVDLRPEGAGPLYRILRRTPRASREDALRERLAAQSPRCDWHAAFLAAVQLQLSAGRSVAPLALDDDAHNHDLLLALDALAGLTEPALERAFSVRVFGDSKRFEALRRSVITVLRRHVLEAAAFGDDDDALLRAHGLARNPEYIPLAGPLMITGPAGRADLGAITPSVAVSAATLRQAEQALCAARAVLTVENSTSFHELLAGRPADVVIVLTGGFASPAVVGLLRLMRASRPDLPLLHWGDLDAGGLRILAHLRQCLGNVQPLLMDAGTFAAYRQYARPLTAHDRDGLRQLGMAAVLADCAGLIESLLAEALKLEQEAVPPGLVWEALDHQVPPTDAPVIGS